MSETAVYDLPHKGYACTITVQSVAKNASLLILSANEQKVLIHPLTRRTQVDNMRPVHTIPL
jgi:hypothetical protein